MLLMVVLGLVFSYFDLGKGLVPFDSTCHRIAGLALVGSIGLSNACQLLGVPPIAEWGQR